MSITAIMASPLWLATGWTMIHLVWVGSLIGALAVLGRRLLTRAHPKWRYAGSLVFLLALAVAPAVIFLGVYERVPDNGETETVVSSPVVVEPSPGRSPSQARAPRTQSFGASIADGRLPWPTAPAKGASRWWFWLDELAAGLPWAWLAGAPLTLGLLASGLVGAERLRRQSRLLTEGSVRAVCDRLAGSLKLARRVGVAVCDRLAAPLLVGIVRPLILLPSTALTGWTPEQLELVLLHELAHVRRWDNLVNLFQRVVESALFFQPAVWWVSAWVRLEREHCCDAVVVATTGRPRAYAEMLVTLAGAGSLSARSAMATAFGEGPLVVRIRCILNLEDRSMKPVAWEGIAGLALIVGGLVLALALGTKAGQAPGDPPPAGAVVQVPKVEAKLSPVPPQGKAPEVDADMITLEADQAIKKGLAWLAQAQNNDGSFVSQGALQGNVGITGLAGLAFMASGSTPGRGPYGASLDKALRYVMDNASPAGFISTPTKSTLAPMYGHGFATLFLAEAYRTTRRPEIREKLEKAVQLIVECQNAEGGWRYLPVSKDADLTATVCQINALRAAWAAGIKVPEETIARSIRYVQQLQNPDGGFRYKRERSPSEFPRSAAGVVALSSLAPQEDKAISAGIAYLRESLPKIDESRGYVQYLYGQYYAAQAMALRGGDAWRAWYPAIRDELLRRQSPSGSWLDSISNEYGTALALIVLATPNHYLPILSTSASPRSNQGAVIMEGVDSNANGPGPVSQPARPSGSNANGLGPVSQPARPSGSNANGPGPVSQPARPSGSKLFLPPDVESGDRP